MAVVLVNKDYFEKLQNIYKAYKLSCDKLERMGKSADKQNAIVEVRKSIKWQNIFIEEVENNEHTTIRERT